VRSFDALRDLAFFASG